jgi:hypothetical protein
MCGQRSERVVLGDIAGRHYPKARTARQPEPDDGNEAESQSALVESALGEELRSVRSFASALGFLGWLIMFGGPIGGIALAVQTGTDSLDSTTHPYVAVGIGVIVGSIISSLFMLLADHAAKAYAFRQALDLN